MKPTDLLYKIHFNFTLIAPEDHPYLDGVQVTCDSNKTMVDIQFVSRYGTKTIRYVYNGLEWEKV